MKTIIIFLTIIIFTFSISSCVEKEEYETPGDRMAKKLKEYVKTYNIKTAIVLKYGEEYSVNYGGKGTYFEIEDNEIYIGWRSFSLEHLVYYSLKVESVESENNFMILYFYY